MNMDYSEELLVALFVVRLQLIATALYLMHNQRR